MKQPSRFQGYAFTTTDLEPVMDPVKMSILKGRTEYFSPLRGPSTIPPISKEEKRLWQRVYHRGDRYIRELTESSTDPAVSETIKKVTLTTGPPPMTEVEDPPTPSSSSATKQTSSTSSKATGSTIITKTSSSSKTVTATTATVSARSRGTKSKQSDDKATKKHVSHVSFSTTIAGPGPNPSSLRFDPATGRPLPAGLTNSATAAMLIPDRLSLDNKLKTTKPIIKPSLKQTESTNTLTSSSETMTTSAESNYENDSEVTYTIDQEFNDEDDDDGSDSRWANLTSKLEPPCINPRFKLPDFEFLGCIGRGSVSRVMLVSAIVSQSPNSSSSASQQTNTDSSDSKQQHQTRITPVLSPVRKTFAVKLMYKSDLMRIPHGGRRCITERNILRRLRHPFIVKYIDSFQDAQSLYLVMEHVPFNLRMLLQREGSLSEPVARFYAAEVASVLEWLHTQRILYRDLKTDNVLIHMDGHIRLCDFGGARRFDSGAVMASKSFMGTGVYMAPEVVLACQYGISVDWWGLGILIYEMIVGKAPFAKFPGAGSSVGAQADPETFLDILDSPLPIPRKPSPRPTAFVRQSLKSTSSTSSPTLLNQQPPYLDSTPTTPSGDQSSLISPLSTSLIDLLQRLLNRHPAKRLGTRGGLHEIRCHPWFKSIKSWAIVEAGLAVPPIDPTEQFRRGGKGKKGNGGDSGGEVGNDVDMTAFENDNVGGFGGFGGRGKLSGTSARGNLQSALVALRKSRRKNVSGKFEVGSLASVSGSNNAIGNSSSGGANTGGTVGTTNNAMALGSLLNLSLPGGGCVSPPSKNESSGVDKERGEMGWDLGEGRFRTEGAVGFLQAEDSDAIDTLGDWDRKIRFQLEYGTLGRGSRELDLFKLW
ncbi:camp-dependent protein kinase catalytic subunit [Blyttiomyces sp. JEL0837]|nr:camp-dependent protein kinase catalytic subunit [Blyttiomyces sp. JEL0837]